MAGLAALVAVSATLVEPGLPLLLGGVLLGMGLATLAAIDLRILRLPDPLTLGLTAIGLLSAALWSRQALPDRLIGAAVGYLGLAALAWAYRRFRGRHGLGMGDAKLLAAAGAWLGWRDLPLVLLAAALCGLAWALLAARRTGRLDASAHVAFGPPLALATWSCWLLHGLTGT